jgi:hypothetical protein
MTWLDDLEERLVRAGTRGIGQQLAGQVGRALGGHHDSGQGDVWDTATHEDERAGGEPPECAWCPLCRAIRLSRQSGPGLAGHMSGAADTLATAAQDALTVLDEILSRAAGPRGGQPPGGPGGPGGPSDQPPEHPGASGGQRSAPVEPENPGDGSAGSS